MKKNNNLDRAYVYLSGSIERAPDGGVGWRDKLTEMVKDSGLNLNLINPCKKPNSLFHDDTIDNISENKEYQEKLQREGHFEELKSYVQKYRRLDLRFVDICDCLAVYIDPEIPIYGTLDELFLAESQKKPVLVVIPGGLYKLPRWLFATLNLDLVFETLEQLVSKLVEINNADKLDDKWVLIRKFMK